MAYLTLAQAKQTLGTDLYESAYDSFVTPGTSDDVVLQEDIDFTTGVIDSALIQTYNTITSPITSIPALALLKGYAESLIKYTAYRRFDDAEVPPVVVDRYREVKDELERLKMGLEFLPGQTQDVLGGAINFAYNSASENTTTPDVLFKRSLMTGI